MKTSNVRGQNYHDDDQEERAQKDGRPSRAAETLPTSRFLFALRKCAKKEKKKIEKSCTWQAVNVSVMNDREAAE